MQIASQIDNLIRELHSLKSQLTDDTTKNTKNFSDLLNQSIHNVKDPDQENVINEVNITSPLPLNKKHHYEYEEDKKPSLRQMVEILAQRDYDELLADPKSNNGQEFINQAVELLYGVVGENNDARNWEKIMNSDDIVKSTKDETKKLFGYELISSQGKSTDIGETVTSLLDKENKVVRTFLTTDDHVKDILNNFGFNYETSFTDGYFQNRLKSKDQSDPGYNIINNLSLKVKQKVDEPISLDQYKNL